ncbi:Ig domain-containing protein [Nocardioides marmorisolisilvae]|uniref:Alpha-amylase n=1 Tax=Nocardioides marmorisolisilvae TaxID=1542737 RepID=A0A3N0DVV3_9ACTN|nr:Ig domain-containing protein [Nocardioides marmorisolisilvae]RNL79752.1 hypothetical protein EFL95_12425 [Nocardioides marmorisolisilvae]
MFKRARTLCLTLVGAVLLLGLTAAPGEADQGEVAIYGYVLDASGAPAPNVSIKVHPVAEPNHYYFTRTAADGSFVVPVPQFIDVYLEISNETEAAGVISSASQQFQTSSSRYEVFSLPARATLVATVTTGAGGLPASGALVRATDPTSSSLSSGGLQFTNTRKTSVCTTTSTGSCDMSVLANGTVSALQVVPTSGYQVTFPGGPTPAGTSTRVLVLPADHEITGVVSTDDGGAAAGVAVELTNSRTGATVTTTTDAAGGYTFHVVPDPYRVRATGTVDHGGTSLRYELRTATFDLDRSRSVALALPAVTQLHVLVRDDLDQPVPGARVDLGAPLSSSARTSADGVAVTGELRSSSGNGLTCAATDAAGGCEFPVLLGGTTAAGSVIPPFGYQISFPGLAAGSGADPQQVVAVGGRASAASAGSTAGTVIALTDSRFTRLEVRPFSAPAGVDPVVGRVDYRVRAGSDGLAELRLVLPQGRVANALMRVASGGQLVQLPNAPTDQPSVLVADGSAADVDGVVDGWVTANVVPVVRQDLVLPGGNPPAPGKGVAYSAQLVASGPGQPFTWSLEPAQPGAGIDGLPTGLSLSPSGLISGTTTAVGDHRFVVRVTDQFGYSTTREYLFTVAAVVVLTRTVPDAYVGTVYSATLKSNATGFPSWKLAEPLPPGLKLANNGTISGTPTSAGSYRFAAYVVSGGVSSPVAYFDLVVGPMDIATVTLPDAPVWSAYSQKLTAHGGKATLVWSVAGGTLPPGVVMSSAGALSGKPTAVGSYPVTFKVKDALGQVATKSLVITVTPMTITTSSLPSVKKGAYYSQLLTASGGKATLAWSLASGTLPPGLTLSSAGRITGYPKTPGTWTFTVRLLDASTPKNQATRTLSITVL